VSFIRTGFREIGLKVRRQKTRMALRHEKRVLQKSEIALGREGVAQAVNFPELRNEIVALKKLEQEQKEVTVRIAQIEEGLKRIEEQRQQNSAELNKALHALEEKRSRSSSGGTKPNRPPMSATASSPVWIAACRTTTPRTAICCKSSPRSRRRTRRQATSMSKPRR
jgi:hypothetical protein